MEATAETILTRADASVANAFAAFCEDIGGMFDVTADCTALASGQGPVADLKKDFKKQISLNHVQSKGAMQGTFDLVFDQAGTLVLAGIFVMLPEKRILEYVRSGYSGESDFISDAIKEAGNLLVGSWDRIYRAEMKDHEHFLQKGTAVGEPWTSPEEYFSFSPDEDCFYRICQITIDPFPPFKCAAIFPMSLFAPAAEAEAPEQATAEPEPQAEEIVEPAATGQEKPAIESASVTEPPAQSEPAAESTAEAEPAAESEGADVSAAQTPETVKGAAEESAGETQPESSAVEDSVTSEEKAPVKEATAETDAGDNAGPVREAIEAMVQPEVQAPAGFGSELLTSLTAEQVMKPAIPWADPEETVEQVMKQMQQSESAYVLIGRDQQIEGLVSRSVIAGAVSPYMRSIFAHLKRPLDDASLQIKIKWFMSRPVHTVSPQASVETVIHTMFKYGVRGLPVVDVKGYVSGFVTVFDVLAALSAHSDSPLLGKPAQAPMCL